MASLPLTKIYVCRDYLVQVNKKSPQGISRVAMANRESLRGNKSVQGFPAQKPYDTSKSIRVPTYIFFFAESPCAKYLLVFKTSTYLPGLGTHSFFRFTHRSILLVFMNHFCSNAHFPNFLVRSLLNHS